MGGQIEDRAAWAQLQHAVEFERRPAAARRKRRGRTGTILALLGITVALAAPLALKAATLAPAGATFTVTSTNDAVDANLANGTCATASGACTLRAAVQQANALAGADTIQIPAGTYALAIRPQNQNLADTGDLDVTGPVTIVGAGPESTIVDGGTPTSNAPEIRGLDRLFEIHPGAGDVSFVGLTLREGYSAEHGGGIYNASTGRLRLEQVRVLESYAAKYGGGIANTAAGRVELMGSRVEGNGAKEGGSAIHNAVAGTVSITAGSAIADNPGNSGNPADDFTITGGAINNEGEGDTIGTIEILDSTVSGNQASSNGAGIYNERDGRVVVRRSAITGNRTSSSGGGVYSVSGTVLIQEGTTISDNHAGSDISSGDGGGVYNAGKMSKAGTPGRLEIANATITGNRAKGDGAGISCGLDADLVITDSTISDNVAEGEGGGVSSQSKADMTVTRATFSGNSAGVAGGGVYAYAEGAASFADTLFTGNTAGETGGGGLYTDGSGGVAVVRSTFVNNTSVGDGGGLVTSSSGAQTVSDSVFRDNRTDEGGGGIFNSGMDVAFLRLSVTGNSALLDGGGIKSEGSSRLAILDTRVQGNSGENGGGFANAADGTMLLSGSTISGNTARDSGGGLLNVSDAVSEVVNSTLSGNIASERGGGLYTNADAELLVVNTTITDNTATAGSGLSTSVESINFPVVPATAVILRNTIVAGNHDGTNCHGAVFSQGGNLDQGTTCYFQDSSDITRTGASLEPLAANGGPTLTHALKPSSVAIDRGVTPCPDVDQRGVARPQNAACDIGSYEFEGTPGPPDSNPLPPPTGPDSDPPSTTLDAKPALRTRDTFAEFKFRADELAVFECVLDPATGASFSGCESPHDYTNLALGLHTFQVRAIDASRNVGQPVTYTWRVVEELVPPETTIGSGPSGLTRATGGSFAFSANEPANFECSLDAATFAACASPYAVSALADGTHTFEVRAIDNSFNVDESPASRTWTVDTTPPETKIDSGPSGLTNDATPAFGFSSETGATFECRVDAVAFAACSTPHTTPELGDGAHTFEVRATDAAGNTDTTPASRGVTVDTTAPETTIESGPQGLTRATDASFAFSATEAGAFACSVNAAEFAACASPLELSALADGVHSVEVRATDAAGNTDQTPARRTWTVDTAPPDTTIDSGPNGLTNDATPAFGFSSEAGATFECRVDAADFAECSPPYAIEVALAEGAHTFAVRASDIAGNTDPSPADRAFTVDTIAPQTTIEAGPSGLINSRTPTFEFSADEQGSMECSLDAAAFAACTSPYTTPSLSEGAHTFDVRAVDQAGNEDGSPASRTFTIDATAPETTIDSGPPALTRSTSADVTFSANETATFVCSLDGAAAAACTSPLELSALADGPHTLDVRARDDAGNTDQTPARRTWTVDTTPPDTTIDSGPSGPTNDATPAFGFSSETGATFECALDISAFAACSSAHTTAVLSDGAHTFHVRALDAAGNEDLSPASRSFTVDTVAPDTTIESGPSGLTNDTTPTFTFSSEAGATVECALDAGAYGACTSPHTTDSLSEGAHTFQVRALDAAGNEDPSPASRAFTVDATAPETRIDSGPSGLTSSASASFAFSADEAASFECRLDGSAFASCTSPQAYTALGDGEHTFAVLATDTAGNTDATAETRVFTVDTTAPDTTILSGPTGLTKDATPTFDFTASEAGSSFECRIDAEDFAGCTSSFTTAALADGAHTFDVRARDAAGNVDVTSASRAFTVDTIAPETTILEGPSGATSDSTPTFTFSSETGATFECALDNGAFAACASPHTTAELTDGAHTFQVRATDAAGNADLSPASRAFSIDAGPPETAIDSGPSGVTTSTSATFRFSAGEPSTFECKLDGGAFASCTSPQDYATLGDGAHTFSVRAIDSAGNRDESPATRAWTVDTAPPQTTIDSGPNGATNVTTPMFTFTSEAGSSFECRVDAAAFAACSSPHTTAALADGPHTFEVQAIDAAGNRDASPAARSFAVDTGAPTLALTGPPAETAETSARFEFSASEPTTGFRCSLDGAAQASCSSPVDRAGLALGPHTFRVEATDTAGNTGSATHAWTIKMAPDTTAPVVTISGPPSSTSSTSATFTFTANEPATFECSLESAPFTGCTSGVTYSGLTPGEHVFRVQATDSAQNQSITGYAWTVTDSTAPVVTITSAPEPSTSSTTATFAFSASEPSNFRCSLDSGTAAVCDSGVSYSGLAPGQHTFLVQATDSDGNVGSASRSWTVVASGGCTAAGTVTLGANADTWVLQSSATSNYGSDSAVKVDTKAGANARVLVRFGLPAIPSGCRIVAAKLRMYAGSYKTGRTLEAAALTAAWGESSVTWSNQPASGGPAASVASGSGYREWEVGSQVSGMYASGNHGFVIRDSSENGQGVEQAFNSREKGSDNPPQLVLTFG